MSKAVAGKPYTVVSGDTLSGISKQAYGDGTKWRLIWKANQTVLRSGDPNKIYPGEVINIPPNPIENAIAEELDTFGSDVTISGKQPDDMTLIIDGTELLIQAGRVVRTMDTCADAWTVTAAWDPDDTKLYELLRPGQYKRASVYLGNILVVDGWLYNSAFGLGADNRTVDLEGWSYTADLIDSTIRPPYEQNKITLKDRATELIEPLGISIQFRADDADEQFGRVTCDAQDTIFDHLVSLATQRKVLISSTRKGEALFWRADTTSTPVGTIEENFPPYQELKVQFNGRDRFNAYRVIGQSPQKKGRKGKDKTLVAIAKDDTVPRSRFKTISVGESTVGNIQQVANWERSKQVAKFLKIPFPVDSWYAPNGRLWRENTIVTVVSKSIYVENGFDFLIRQVEYIYGPEGTIAVLDLVPPQTYTGEDIKEPWVK